MKRKLKAIWQILTSKQWVTIAKNESNYIKIEVAMKDDSVILCCNLIKDMVISGHDIEVQIKEVLG